MSTVTAPDAATYVEAATVAVQAWTLAAPTECPECRQSPRVGDPVHVVIVGPGQVPAVLVGCEGYQTIRPDLLTLPAGGWQPTPAWPFPKGA